jgi:3-hydroxyisobutyrate dehydrogenase-like beta-hydroxyacid dehydrogenase
METIGFVGLGHMGGHMAARYLQAGYTVHGEDGVREHAQSLIDQGLHWADTPRALAKAADIVMTSLPNDDVVNSVASGLDGIIAGLGAGKLWADLSTISPSTSRELAARVRDHGRGAQMLDTPVSGSVPQVETGSLTLMVGGDEKAFTRLKPVLRVLGTPVHVGDNGQGLVLKLAINISLFVQMDAFSEGLLLAQREGVDPHLAAKVMSESAIGSPTIKARVPLVLDRPDETWFDMAMMHKDIRLALATAREQNLQLPSAALADQLLTEATGRGYEHRDIASIYSMLGQAGAVGATSRG